MLRISHSNTAQWFISELSQNIHTPSTQKNNYSLHCNRSLYFALMYSNANMTDATSNPATSPDKPFRARSDLAERQVMNIHEKAISPQPCLQLKPIICSAVCLGAGTSSLLTNRWVKEGSEALDPCQWGKQRINPIHSTLFLLETSRQGL